MHAAAVGGDRGGNSGGGGEGGSSGGSGGGSDGDGGGGRNGGGSGSRVQSRGMPVPWQKGLLLSSGSRHNLMTSCALTK